MVPHWLWPLQGLSQGRDLDCGSAGNSRCPGCRPSRTAPPGQACRTSQPDHLSVTAHAPKSKPVKNIRDAREQQAALKQDLSILNLHPRTTSFSRSKPVAQVMIKWNWHNNDCKSYHYAAAGMQVRHDYPWMSSSVIINQDEKRLKFLSLSKTDQQHDRLLGTLS